MKPIIPENIREWLKQVAQDWAKQTIDLLSQKAKKVGVRAEGELLQNFTYFLANATESQIGITFQLPAYGKMIDMKGLNPVQKGLWLLATELKDWIIRENIGFTPKNSKWSAERAKTQFAWAIARTKMKSNRKHKRKRWFSKNFYGQINYLLQQIAQGHAEYANLAITENLK
ncbi:hypothetical protein AD998_07670 [bacterium 336/3]|nr:hypothetical protein AD998_07670 [bacterium 336/3]